MSLESEYPDKYGVIAAGAVGKSLIGRLPSKVRDIGPVAGTSYRVASRLANALRAGNPARDLSELNRARIILFHSPPEYAAHLVKILDAAPIEWAGKPLIICGCEIPTKTLEPFAARGAGIAAADDVSIPGYLVIRGASAAAHRLARELKLRPIDVPPERQDTFNAALTLSGAGFTALVDQVTALLKRSGVRENEAARLAAALFRSTAADYAHSGRQSWDWYTRPPEVAELEAQIRGAGPNAGDLLRTLALLGFTVFDKHRSTESAVRSVAAGK